MFSNNVNRIEQQKYYLKSILKENRRNRNKIDHGWDDKVNTLLHKYDIKHEVFFVENQMD